MFWIALHFPLLSLEIFSRGAAISGPLAVIEKQGNRAWVMQCNETASEIGVRPGMPVSSAQAIASDLVVRPRNLAAEQESLSGIAAWAGRFTPSVSLQPPDGLLLEVGSCLSLHRGLDHLLDKVRGSLADMGYAYSHACAPTPRGAWMLALAVTQAVIRESSGLDKALGELTVRVLDQPEETLADLEMVGAHTLGECMRLPRAGMARRFGTGLLDELDRALGRVPEPRDFFVPPPSFERRLELPAQVNEAEGLLFAARRLLPELEGYLNLRQSGVQEFELICCHEDVSDTVLKLAFMQTTRSMDRMQLLLRETLANVRLPAPVHTIVLKASLILPISASNANLFQDDREAGENNLLLERLRIRLGKEAVFGIAPAADHRPELAWKRCRIGKDTRHPGKPQRPLWLLPRPLPCEKSRLTFHSGPERIESGWWDGRDVRRDYYVARHQNGSHVWVFYEHRSGSWFVHGLFA
jgi:protein ImuB